VNREPKFSSFKECQNVRPGTEFAVHKKAKEMEKKRNAKRRRLFEAQDKIDERKEGLIEEIEMRLQQAVEEDLLFSIHWQII